MFKNFADARKSQPAARKGGGATQVTRTFTHDELGNVEERVLAAVETLGLEPRPTVVEKVQGMIADYQSPKGAAASNGISVYEATVSVRGAEAIAALS